MGGEASTSAVPSHTFLHSKSKAANYLHKSLPLIAGQIQDINSRYSSISGHIRLADWFSSHQSEGSALASAPSIVIIVCLIGHCGE